MSTLVRARSYILLYDVMVTNGTVNFEGPTAIQMCLMTLVESKAYLLVTTILSVLAILPYLTFIIFTVCYKSLMKPKNVFKSNFAFSAIIHLIGVVVQLIVFYEELQNICPQMYLIWWSATGLTASVLLIELDRFLAIRFPFKYPLLITDERALGACAITQLGSLSVTLAVRIGSADSFACAPLHSGHHLVQRALFLFIVVIPYFICFLLSLVCALYVVKALLNQVRKDNKVNPGIYLLNSPGGEMDVGGSKVFSIEAKCYYSDDMMNAFMAPQATTIMSATIGLAASKATTNTNEEVQEGCSTPLQQQQNNNSAKLQLHQQQHRMTRTMSCPARLRIEDPAAEQRPPIIIADPQFRLFRQGSNFALGLNLEELKRDFKSTIKTLAMLFVYLLMSSPLYISAAVHSNCLEAGDCRQFGVYVIIFYNVSMLGLVIYPYIWLLLDKHFAEKICHFLKKLRTHIKCYNGGNY